MEQHHNSDEIHTDVINPASYLQCHKYYTVVFYCVIVVLLLLIKEIVCCEYMWKDSTHSKKPSYIKSHARKLIIHWFSSPSSDLQQKIFAFLFSLDGLF